jgi:hypothetical protein
MNQNGPLMNIAQHHRQKIEALDILALKVWLQMQ